MKKLMSWIVLVCVLAAILSGCQLAVGATPEQDQEQAEDQQQGQDRTLREMEYLPDTSLETAMQYRVFYIGDDFMFYFDNCYTNTYESPQYLHRAKLDGSEHTVLYNTDGYIGTIAICGEWIFVVTDGTVVRISQQYDENAVIYSSDAISVSVYALEDRLVVYEKFMYENNCKILALDGEEIRTVSDIADCLYTMNDGTYIYFIDHNEINRMDKNGTVYPFVELEQSINSPTYHNDWIYCALCDDNYDVTAIGRYNVTTGEWRALFDVKDIDNGHTFVAGIVCVVDNKIYYCGWTNDDPYYAIFRCDLDGGNNELVISNYSK